MIMKEIMDEMVNAIDTAAQLGREFLSKVMIERRKLIRNTLTKSLLLKKKVGEEEDNEPQSNQIWK